jgi:hypothetical protein
MITTYKATPDIDVLTSSFPIPGFGLVPINAFVLHGPEPILVDTGTVVDSDEFMATLRSVIDPADLQWIWLTHTDFDHIGSLPRLLDDKAQLRVITTFLGVGIVSMSIPLPMDRVHLLNPGQKITVGDWTLTAVKPPRSTTQPRLGSWTTHRDRCSPRTASVRSSRTFPTTPLTCPTTSCGKRRSSGRPSTRRGSTTSTAPSSRRS